MTPDIAPSDTTSPPPVIPSSISEPTRAALEPMDPQLTSIQPGGGVVIHWELCWGELRRWCLKTFRPRYVARMRGLRRGEFNGCPHEVLDPRDVKFYRNQGGYYWAPQDDPFRWRDRLGFARVGLAELLVMGVTPTIIGLWMFIAALRAPWPWPLRAAAALVGLTAAVIGGLIIWFFRNPNRVIPPGTNVVVAPADGKIVEVEEVIEEDFIGGPAVKIGIFLSIFNVHVNRMPIRARVIGLRYRPGKMLNALRPESARENEQLAIRIEGENRPHRRMIVRQITGALARRIVCWLKPGDVLDTGEQFGMIKLGSRTELILPREPGLQIVAKVGDTVEAGASLIARYDSAGGK